MSKTISSTSLEKMYWYYSFIIHLKHCQVNNKKYIIQEKVVPTELKHHSILKKRISVQS